MTPVPNRPLPPTPMRLELELSCTQELRGRVRFHAHRATQIAAIPPRSEVHPGQALLTRRAIGVWIGRSNATRTRPSGLGSGSLPRPASRPSPWVHRWGRFVCAGFGASELPVRKWQTWQMQRKLTPAQWAAVLIAHVVVASLVWRDLRHRPDDQIRGSKRFWRIASAANSGNSLIYLVFGRRRTKRSEEG